MKAARHVEGDISGLEPAPMPRGAARSDRDSSMVSRPTRSQYEDFMRHVFEHGTPKTDRTGTGTRSVFGHQMRFDLRDGFPLLTTKKLHVKSIIHELLWFLSGDTNIKYL